jgi:hypothetical protein
MSNITYSLRATYVKRGKLDSAATWTKLTREKLGDMVDRIANKSGKFYDLPNSITISREEPA